MGGVRSAFLMAQYIVNIDAGTGRRLKNKNQNRNGWWFTNYSILISN
jgi:hypothetical protein